MSRCSFKQPGWAARSTLFAVAATLVLLVLGRSASAERDLSLREALVLAKKHNHDLEAARARLLQARAGVEQARSALLPTVTAQGKYTHNDKGVTVVFPTMGAGLQVVTIQKQEQLDGYVQLTTPLVAPWAYPAFAASRHTFESARASFEVTETSVLYQVAQTFFLAAGSDELVLARRHAIEVAQKTMDDAKTRFDAGTVNRTEITRAELSLVRAQQDEAFAEDNQKQAYRALATLCGLTEPVRVAPPDESTLGMSGEDPQQLLRLALRLRPELTMLSQQVAAADSEATANGWRWAPTISGFGIARRFNYTGFTGEDFAWAVGAQLDFVLYDAGVRDAQRHSAQARRAESQAQLSLLYETVSDEVANARQALATRRLSLRAAERSVELSRETLELVRVQREAGTATQLDLLAAQDSLAFAEVGLAQAHFDLAMADLTLARSTGTFPGERSPR
jgi:outer membrane protein TolC